MSTSPPVWTFQQIPTQVHGPLTLGGWSAPFGRPRNGAIFNGGIQQRYSRTNYPGKNVKPTIHKFGTMLKPIEMHGRWMDRTIPLIGGAQQYVGNWKNFIADGMTVRMTWGGIISYQIFIHDIDLNFESPAEVAWLLKAECLVDEQGPVLQGPPTTQAPFDIASAMNNAFPALVPFNPQVYGTLLGLLGEVSDGLDQIKATLNSPFATIYNTCSAITSFETAVNSDLTSMLSGVTAMQTGLLNLRDQTDYMCSSVSELNTPNAFAINQINGGLLTGADVLQFTTDKTASDAAMNQFLELLAELHLQITQVQRGTAVGAYIAQAGDTWESAAANRVGSADAGRSWRAMNAIKYGHQPQPGKTYNVPKQ